MLKKMNQKNKSELHLAKLRFTTLAKLQVKVNHRICPRFQEVAECNPNKRWRKIPQGEKP